MSEPVEGIVEQTAVGLVYRCSVMRRCMASAGGTDKAKVCLLSVNHTDRCCAWVRDRSKWLITTDTNNIKQLPLVDVVRPTLKAVLHANVVKAAKAVLFEFDNRKNSKTLGLLSMLDALDRLRAALVAIDAEAEDRML